MEKEVSASRIEKGLHRFTLEKYSMWKDNLGRGNCVHSGRFTVGGHQWAIDVSIDGTNYEITKVKTDIYVGLHLAFMGESDEGVLFSYWMTLLDQSGQGNHLTLPKSSKRDPVLIRTRYHYGRPCFIRRDILESSSYLKDDCLKIEFTVHVQVSSSNQQTDHGTNIGVSKIDSHVGVDFLALLETGEGHDIIFKVGSKKFRAHKAIISARSSVFGSMAYDQREMVITGVEPRVFKALLHFIYSDTLPEEEGRLVAGYAFGPSLSSTFGVKLLAAADEYNLRGLKSICESYLWRTISLNCFAEILSLAGRYNAFDLKRCCFEYAAENYDALAELKSFITLGKNSPLMLKELDEYISNKRSMSKVVT
ncbi:hypothetical protein CDL12_15989 [Handroanthus impetiginosus]|uniref:Speckle-type POZ protein SPOP n=1 Tax=Handroanthus impetiginosus TaxID=429701 RepID=A0A2G9H1K9_9LAMI|nr:hypothetical protein CDL12_15989 [Handroanthus impetiginosus]